MMSWSTNRCWNCFHTFAQMVSRHSSYPVAGSNSCERFLNRYTEFLRNRSLGAASKQNLKCEMELQYCCAFRRSISWMTKKENRWGSTSTSGVARSQHSEIPMAISKCCNGHPQEADCASA